MSERDIVTPEERDLINRIGSRTPPGELRTMFRLMKRIGAWTAIVGGVKTVNEAIEMDWEDTLPRCAPAMTTTSEQHSNRSCCTCNQEVSRPPAVVTMASD